MGGWRDNTKSAKLEKGMDWRGGEEREFGRKRTFSL